MPTSTIEDEWITTGSEKLVFSGFYAIFTKCFEKNPQNVPCVF